ncbi:pyocin activator PrtN family protein [Pseudomonas sp. 10S4]|uniref:pyocin activator PrtN family protein n=1 Tax=Pseudomonas sp. 10S4 TaxID=3048583 RepID=UPI002AC8CFB6|nr:MULTISPECIES: pyocin activator PrtN family protein [unclassified Pseudomonas]MEB0223564.1 pyocin activator PrtN family protein [Pseudomonas sp. 5S1]MEB0295743.1 pyocin activator PrtN family protein [Pseudomonas sp. 10S4]WPX21012.1 pyocin activator PrtN family protein [Pseudomonas sp. 10S4]
MSNTLEQLRRQFATPCPTLSVVREQYFTHIRTDRYLLTEIKAGRIALVVKRLHGSARAQRVVYLHDLADFLDAQAMKEAA